MSVVFISTCLAQMPGKWERHNVCGMCKPPAIFDFTNNVEGLVVTQSSPIQQPLQVLHVYKTTSGGNEWFYKSDTVDNFLLYSVRPLSTFHLPPDFISFNVGGILVYSNDAGSSWHRKGGLSGEIHAGHIISPSTMFNLTTNSTRNLITLFATRDTGLNYSFYNEQYSLPPLLKLGSACFVDSLELWGVVNRVGTDTSIKARCIHTTNGGVTWAEIYPYDTTSYFYAGLIQQGASKGTVYIIRNYAGPSWNNWEFLDAKYTTDNGMTWYDCASLGGRLRELHNPESTLLWGILSDYKTIVFSSDNGSHWSYDSTTFGADSIHSMYWEDSSHGYVLTYKDSSIHLYKYISASESVEKSISYGNTNFRPRLVRNYFEFEVAVKESVITEVYDLLGQLVLYGRTMPQDDLKLRLDVSSLSPGVYLLRLQNGTKVVHTRFIKVI